MKLMLYAAIPLAMFTASAVAADVKGASEQQTTVVHFSNEEMRRIFEADQAARRTEGPIDWERVRREDAERLARTNELLVAGALRTGEDFFYAAFVFQHGRRPSDYLMAHTLATIAAARGRAGAPWIAAASLDRYLKSIGQPQIYGTQFTRARDEAATQEPYDRALVPDLVREALGVPTLAEQQKQLEKMNEARR